MRCFSLLCMLTCCWTLSCIGAEPHADHEELPTLVENEIFTHTFTVTNPYDRAAKVERIDSSCSCETLEMAKEFLLPHESTTLHMAATNDNSSGIRTHRIWIYFTDPAFTAIERQISWRVLPLVSFDSLPAQHRDPLARPEPAFRDIYRYATALRPDEAQRMRKVIRVGCAESLVPEGGLRIESLAYEGSLWQFSIRQLEDQPTVCLIVAQAKDPEAALPNGEYIEPLIVTLNQADKTTSKLLFHTIIDPEIGREGAPDPFAEFR